MTWAMPLTSKPAVHDTALPLRPGSRPARAGNPAPGRNGSGGESRGGTCMHQRMRKARLTALALENSCVPEKSGGEGEATAHQQPAFAGSRAAHSLQQANLPPAEMGL